MEMKFLRNFIFPGGLMPHGPWRLWTWVPIAPRMTPDSPSASSRLPISMARLCRLGEALGQFRENPYAQVLISCQEQFV
jgi:hypothetical protein